MKNGVFYGFVLEVVRGEGGCLVDENGCRIMVEWYFLGDLVLRDIVLWVIYEEMVKGNCVYIDFSVIFDFEMCFFIIIVICEKVGIDIYSGKIFVVLGMYFLMGGVLVNCWGEMIVLGFYVIGEIVCFGLYGVNWFVSNFLLEVLVFGKRVVEYII